MASWSLRSLRSLGHQEAIMVFSLPCPPSPAFEGRSGGQLGWWILTITEYPGEPCSAGGTSENQTPPSNGLHPLVAVGYWEELDL